MSVRQILRSRGTLPRRAILLIGVAVLAFLADSALNRFAFSDGWTILWPLNGFTVAALLMLPRRHWPWVMAAVATGTYFGEVEDNIGWIDGLWQRALSILEVVLTALLLPPFRSLEEWLCQPNIFRRLVVAFSVGPGVSGVLAALYFHEAFGQAYLEAFSSWGPADALGLAAVMPLVFSMRSNEMRRLFRRRRIRRTLVILALAFAVSALIFFETRYPLVFALYPVLLLVDLTLGFAGSAITVALTCLIAVWMTTNGEGPFANLPGGFLSRNMSLQIFLGFHILILFPASILFLERKRVNMKLRQAYAHMSRLAAIDQLTGIANRRSLDIAIVQEWSRSLRDHVDLAILMVDLDYFKEYNDALGHQAGDRCLAAVASAIASQAARPGDVVARYGGEEFAILLPNTTPEGAQLVATRVIEAVVEMRAEHPSRGAVTVSVGCAALTPTIGTSSDLLISLADQALYLAKQQGRNRIHALVDQDRSKFKQVWAA